MPIYDYVCKGCGNKFEVVYFKIENKQKKAKCPKCGKQATRVPSVSARMKQNWSSWNVV
ncbi:MAG: hypothetical protein DRN26_00285 [Thermoplasmata archaeon]|nr:MAG: hypothetical protein DRN26_00285 [Thermoplasmata archaeon]